VITLALGAGFGLDLVNSLERDDGLGWTNRLAIATGGAYISYNLKSHDYSPNYFY
jgi:hypothetical protein